MAHLLDNPAWHALNSGNQPLAHGDGPIRYFWHDVSPFVGLENNSVEQLEKLHRCVPFDGPLTLVSTVDLSFPYGWEVLHVIPVLQMVCPNPPRKSTSPHQVVPLTDADVPRMLELTRLTKPGPFSQHTIRFGHYEGIFDQGKLIAMAGQRLNPTPFAEISAVCTHPDFLGLGLARHLLSRQLSRIQAAGETPFLHVKSDNDRAIKVYAGLGFEKRAELIIYMLRKKELNNPFVRL